MSRSCASWIRHEGWLERGCWMVGGGLCMSESDKRLKDGCGWVEVPDGYRGWKAVA